MGLLVLMRHAKAVREHEAASDQARELTARGRRDAAAAGAAMAEAGLTPLAMLVSPAARTRATAHLVRPLLPSPLTVELVEGLYLASARDIWDLAAPQIGRGVLVVGHNPGLHALVSLLVTRSGDASQLARRLQEGLPTAAWAAFDVEGEPLPSAAPRLLSGWSPKD